MFRVSAPVAGTPARRVRASARSGTNCSRVRGRDGCGPRRLYVRRVFGAGPAGRRGKGPWAAGSGRRRRPVWAGADRTAVPAPL